MNDYVVFYTSKRSKNDYVSGAKWDPCEIPIKEFCRNDPDRSLKIEIYEWRRVKGVIYNFFVTEAFLTLNKIVESVGDVFPMFANKLVHGRCKIVSFEKKYNF